MVPAVLRFIDTRGGSRNSHYVNHSVRGFRPPAGWRISPARFDLLRLRMRRISRPQVVASPIRPTPGATHSVITRRHPAFTPSARLLIPDPGPAQAHFAHAAPAALAGSYSQ